MWRASSASTTTPAALDVALGDRDADGEAAAAWIGELRPWDRRLVPRALA